MPALQQHQAASVLQVSDPGPINGWLSRVASADRIAEHETAAILNKHGLDAQLHDMPRPYSTRLPQLLPGLQSTCVISALGGFPPGFSFHLTHAAW